MNTKLHYATTLAFTLFACISMRAQFLDTFDDGNVEGWDFYTGDGKATVDFTPKQDFARMEVDASEDRYNVWWAIIRRDISSFVDLEKLESPEYELRVEIKLRPGSAPRRVNIMVNTNRTTDYHKQLREYDLSSKGTWQTISFTTEDLDVRPGDNLYVQMGMTDWGHRTYFIDVDSYKAEAVKVSENEHDVGEPLVYHPPIAPIGSFEQHLPVAEDAMINENFPEVNFDAWRSGGQPVLTISDRQFPILRWDLSEFEGKQAAGSGVLELTTHSVAKGGNYSEPFGEDLGMEFDKIRIYEILGGDSDWTDESVTFQSFTQGQALWDIVNEQMVFDTELTENDGGKTYVTLSRPVMQRLLDGSTRGLILMPLGAIDASLYDSRAANGSYAPILHFSTQ